MSTRWKPRREGTRRKQAELRETRERNRSTGASRELMSSREHGKIPRTANSHTMSALVSSMRAATTTPAPVAASTPAQEMIFQVLFCWSTDISTTTFRYTTLPSSKSWSCAAIGVSHFERSLRRIGGLCGGQKALSTTTGTSLWRRLWRPPRVFEANFIA